jgi:hypothetical protein
MSERATTPSPPHVDNVNDRLTEVVRQIERLTAIIYVVSGRLSAVEAALAVTAPSPMTTTNFCTMKDATFLTGRSASGLRKLIRAGKVRAEWHGGRLLIDADTLPARVRKSA